MNERDKVWMDGQERAVLHPCDFFFGPPVDL